MLGKYLKALRTPGVRSISTVRNYINGEFVESKTTEFIEGSCPST